MKKFQLTAQTIITSLLACYTGGFCAEAQNIGDAYLLDGTTATASELNGQTVVGMVVDVEEGKWFTVMAAEPIAEHAYWGSQTHGKVSDMEIFSTFQQAQTDTAGWSNTLKIASFYSQRKEESIGSKILSSKHLGISGWHIPSAGEWANMMRNVGKGIIDAQTQYSTKYLPSETSAAELTGRIEEALTAIGGQSLDPKGQGTAYWTSTQKSEMEAVEIYFKKGQGAQVFYAFKADNTSPHFVRPFKTISLIADEQHPTPPASEPDVPTEPAHPTEPSTPTEPQEPSHVGITLPTIDGYKIGDILYDDNTTSSSQKFDSNRMPVGIIVAIDATSQKLTLLSAQSFDAGTYATAMLTESEMAPPMSWRNIYNDTDGKANTDKLSRLNTATIKSPAALVAQNYNANGLEGWYIPSAGEWCRLLQQMGGASIGEENNAWGSSSSLIAIGGPAGAPSQSILRNIDSVLIAQGVEPLLPQGIDEKRYWSSTANNIASHVNVTFAASNAEYPGTYVTYATTSDESLSIRLMNRITYPTASLALGDTIMIHDPANGTAHLTFCVSSLYPRELTLQAGAVAGELSLPDHIEGPDELQYTVVEIADKAFADNDSLVVIALPYTIRRIGEQAFAGCANVKAVIFDSDCYSLPQWPDGTSGLEFSTASGNTYIVAESEAIACLREQFPAWAERIVAEMPKDTDAMKRTECRPTHKYEWYSIIGQRITQRNHRGLYIANGRLRQAK